MIFDDRCLILCSVCNILLTMVRFVASQVSAHFSRYCSYLCMICSDMSNTASYLINDAFTCSRLIDECLKIK